ncbi:MAG: helix-turn-helix domain-containing protein [Pseudomonadota bacterium]
MKTYSIGETARRTGVKVPTIRYYEGIGLLPKTPRHDNNRRYYDNGAVERLSFIKHAREMGFDITDIATLLALRETPKKSCGEADRIARARLADVETRIGNLLSLKSELEGMIRRCRKERVATCQVMESISERSC